MVNKELLDFIRKSIIEGSSKEQIKNTLSSGGWSESDIEEGYLMVTSPSLIHQANLDKRESNTLLNEYAGFWIRVLSYFIDMFACVVFIMPFGIFLETESNLFRVITSIIVIFYFVFMTKKYQATLGKMAVGIKVISEKSQDLTIGQVILRETIGRILSQLIFSIGYIAVAFTSKKQGFHDLIAKTLVVYK